MWEWICIDPHFIDLGTSWRWVASFTPLPLYPRGKSPLYPAKEVGWTPEPVWTTWRRENSWPYRDSNSGLSIVWFEVLLFFNFFSWYGGGGVNWVHSALRPLIGLLCQPRVIMMTENLVEWLAGETELLWENLPQCRFVHHKPHMLSGRERGPPRWEASD
jgi:hypothetical protein